MLIETDCQEYRKERGQRTGHQEHALGTEALWLTSQLTSGESDDRRAGDVDHPPQARTLERN